MIDIETLNRNLKDCIMQFPVEARHLGRDFMVKLNATADIMQTLGGGTRDDMAITVVGTKAEFSDRPPKSGDDFALLINGNWIVFQVRDVPGYYDPMSPAISIHLQSPHKGIS